MVILKEFIPDFSFGVKASTGCCIINTVNGLRRDNDNEGINISMSCIVCSFEVCFYPRIHFALDILSWVFIVVEINANKMDSLKIIAEVTIVCLIKERISDSQIKEWIVCKSFFASWRYLLGGILNKNWEKSRDTTKGMIEPNVWRVAKKLSPVAPLLLSRL